jgi:hypothetical protein
MEPNDESRRPRLRDSTLFQWPNSAIIIGFLVLTSIVRDLAPSSGGAFHDRDAAAVGDTDSAREARYWGTTDQVKIDRHGDKGFFLFGQPVPGGCLYEASNSDDPSAPATAGSVAFAPFPCHPDSGRAPDGKPSGALASDDRSPAAVGDKPNVATAWDDRSPSAAGAHP